MPQAQQQLRVLIVDDEPAVCISISEYLKDRGHAVETAASFEHARERLSSFQPGVVVLDVRLPGVDGLTALEEMHRRFPGLPIIVVTAFGDLETAVAALGRGAQEYLVKPFELGELARAIAAAAACHTNGQGAPRQPPPGGRLIGRGRAMQEVFRKIALVAPTDLPVLLMGETGTGKELVARAIHDHSTRAAGPFVPLCPATLNPALIESELFGHVRGAFTGANADRPGLFELATGGTIFLDEIAETPLAVQVKLLRVLETHRFCPVGSGADRPTDARLIAATHRNLPQMIAAGAFREDLFHRLKVFAITLPPLRDRQEDLQPLAEHFLAQHAPGVQPAGISREFWEELRRRPWPGNVRELRNAMDHAVVMARKGLLEPRHLPAGEQPLEHDPGPDDQLAAAVCRWVRVRLAAGYAAESAGTLRDDLLRVVERHLVMEALQATGGKRSAAARLLGIDRATLRLRLRGPGGEGAHGFSEGEPR